MKSLSFLYYIPVLILFIFLHACKKDSIENDQLDPAACEDGTNCRRGAVCEMNVCECAEGYYYLSNYYEYWRTDSICKKVKSNQFILTDSEGDSEIFKYWSVAEIAPAYLDSLPGTMRLHFYPESTPDQAGKDAQPAMPYLVDLYQAGDDVSGFPIEVESKMIPFKFLFYRGVTEMDWEVTYFNDSIIINTSFIHDIEKSAKLIYTRIGN